MLSKYNLKTLNQDELSMCDKAELIDIRGVTVDPNKPTSEKLCDYIGKVKNPYRFKVGDTPVEIHFNPNGGKLDTMLAAYLSEKNTV